VTGRRHLKKNTNQRIGTSRPLNIAKTRDSETPSYKKRDCETHITAQKTRLRDPWNSTKILRDPESLKNGKKNRFSCIRKTEHECLGNSQVKFRAKRLGTSVLVWGKRQTNICCKTFPQIPSKNHWKMKWLALKKPKAKTKLRIVSDPQHTAGKIAALRQLLLCSFRLNGHTYGFPSDTQVRTILNNSMINSTKGKLDSSIQSLAIG